MSRHPSDLVWSRYLDGALGPLDRARLHLHVRRCERCRDERAALAAQREAFLRSPDRSSEIQAIAARAPRDASSRSVERGWRRLNVVAVLGATAVAAAVLLVVLTPRPGRDELIAKGADEFTVLFKRAETVAPLGHRCLPGDALRARVHTRRKQVLIVGVDPAGSVSALHPFGGTSSVAVNPEGELTPGSWVLDGAPGRERFIAFFSDSPVDLEAARAAISQTPTGPPLLPGATVLERSCVKESP